MKTLTIIFLLLPVLSFGQTKVNIDSVSLIKYDGSSQKKTNPYYLSTSNDDSKQSNTKSTISQQNKENDFTKDFPNYNKDRDMPLPVQTKRILDSKGRFHPTAKWETYQTFPPDSIGFLLDILYCNLPMKDTIWTIDKSGNQTLPIEYKKYRTGMCFSPGLGILI